MNRKNTILIAVLINAGLLLVLLIAALTSQEEVASPLIGEAGPQFSKTEENPLFNDSLDLAMKKPAENSTSPIAIPIPEGVKPVEMKESSISLAGFSENKEDTMAHKLPPLAPESQPSPIALAEPVPASTQPAAASPFVEVTVKKGDSLEKIAKNHRTTVDEILKINHLASTFLKVGQVLKVPADKSLAAAPKTKPAVQEAKPAAASTEYYTVKVGDNPWTIAMKHHLKIEELLRLNGLNEEKARKLKPGDRLRIR